MRTKGLASAVPPQFASQAADTLSPDQHPAFALTGSPVPVYFLVDSQISTAFFQATSVPVYCGGFQPAALLLYQHP